MRRFLGLGLLLVAGAPSAGVASDAWEFNPNDNCPVPATNCVGTANALSHGAQQQHDLQYQASQHGISCGDTGQCPTCALGGCPDEDWFQVPVKAYSSYEVIVDQVTHYVGATFRLVHFPVAGNASARGVALGVNERSLRWENASASSQTEWVRVGEPACDTTCGALATYSIRLLETTYAVPRFNNTADQRTVLVIQNPSHEAVNGHVWFWSTAGALLDSYQFGGGGANAAIAVKGLLVLNTSTVAGAASQAGSITITHSARYGALAIKTVVLDPGTGFSFDTPGLPRPH